MLVWCCLVWDQWSVLEISGAILELLLCTQEEEVIRNDYGVNILTISLGALVFLIVWSCFLWIWSIPLILIEYATGRYFRKGTVESAYNLAGPSFRFMGAWMVVVSNAIG